MSLSTHVLNTTTGLPAAGLAFALFSAVSNAASDSTSDTAPAIETGTTDADGRYRFTTPLDPGTYRSGSPPPTTSMAQRRCTRTSTSPSPSATSAAGPMGTCTSHSCSRPTDTRPTKGADRP